MEGGASCANMSEEVEEVVQRRRKRIRKTDQGECSKRTSHQISLYKDRHSDEIIDLTRGSVFGSTPPLGIGSTSTYLPTKRKMSTQEPHQHTSSVLAPLKDGPSIGRHSLPETDEVLILPVPDTTKSPCPDDDDDDDVIITNVTSTRNDKGKKRSSVSSHSLQKGISSKRSTMSTNNSVIPSTSFIDNSATQFSFPTPPSLNKSTPRKTDDSTNTPQAQPIASIKSSSCTSKSSISFANKLSSSKGSSLHTEYDVHTISQTQSRPVSNITESLRTKSHEAMHAILSSTSPLLPSVPLPGSTAVSMSHHKPVARIVPNVSSSSSHSNKIVAHQIITKSVVSSSLFVSKRSLLLSEVGSGCDLSVSLDKSKIIITGEKHQVNVIIDHLERELSRFEETLTSEVINVEAFYAPLLIEESFIKEMKDEFTSVELTIQTCSGKKLTFDEMFQSLKFRIERRRGTNLLMLKDIYDIDLLSQVETNVEKQWFIQDINGHWDQVPASTNRIFNDQVESQSTITVEDQGIYYKVNFQEMSVINCHTGFKHPLKNEVVWYYQNSTNSGSGFSSYSVNECIQIERCYKTHQCIPVHCRDDRVCLFSFQSQVEIDITNNNSMRRINRQPPISTAFLLPSFSVCVTGVPADIKPAIKKFKQILQTKINNTSIPMPQCCKEVFESNAQQYCLETTIQGGLVSIKGIQQYLALAMLELLKVQDSSRPAVREVSFYDPSEWERQKDDIEVKILHNRVSKEWLFVETIWKRTMRCPIKKIERIQNKWLWQHYRFCQERLKTKNKGRDNEKWLFHGTNNTLPEYIYKSDKGFDFRFASSGMWGKGTYFAVNASYSANGYAFTQFMTGDKQVFLARVLTGDSAELAPKKDLKMPPLKDAKDNFSRYDSVKGNTRGSDIYVVYEHDKAYPAYLVTF